MCNQSQGCYGSNNTLSPAAQAVLSAYRDEAMDYIEEWGSFKHKRGIAAALRAAADHCDSGELALTCLHSIHAIADELEASSHYQFMDLSIVNSLSPVQKFSEGEERDLLFSLSACVNAPIAVRLRRDQSKDGKLIVTLIPVDPESTSV